MRFLGVTALAAVSFAQSFEVASIRPHEGAIRSIGTSIDGTRVTSTGSVYSLIMYAYDLDSYEVSGIPIPNSMEPKEFYDISARAPGSQPPTIAEARKMVQALLAERFQLKFHRETRELNVFSMVVAKGGPKLRKSSEAGSRVTMDGKSMTFTGAPISMLAQQLSVAPGVDRPVIDKTDLAGTYDFQLNFIFRPDGLTGPGGESIFTAIEEQLGVKLERQKAPIEVLVVDSVQKPSEN